MDMTTLLATISGHCVYYTKICRSIYPAFEFVSMSGSVLGPLLS
jgi:hypothetical protein